MFRKATTILLAFCFLVVLSVAFTLPTTATDHANKKTDDTAQRATIDPSAKSTETNESNSQKNIHTAHPVLPDGHFSYVGPHLPFQAYLLSLYDRGYRGMGRPERNLAGAEAHLQVPPLGPARLRPGTQES